MIEELHAALFQAVVTGGTAAICWYLYRRYRRVDFENPPETLWLPSAIETVSVIRGGTIQRFRVTQRFSDHRRFLTGGRIVD